MPNQNLKLKIFFLAIIFCGVFGVAGKTLAATINAASCSQSDVIVAIAAASDGDIVNMPAGSCTWGAGGTSVSITKDITLQGAGRDLTIINIDPTAGSYGNAIIGIGAAATVKSFTIQTATSGNSGSAFAALADGFRISDIKYIGRTTTITGYFVYGGAYGLIDNCDVTGGAGNNELIFVRGPADSWQTDNSIGGVDNVFVENCTFGGSGYVCDFNSNSRGVLRYNTITGPMKIDGHGIETNTPARSVRHMEVYNNHWTNLGSYWTSFEIRGGTGRIFNNVVDSLNVWNQLKQYASLSPYPGYFNYVCQCPSMYPITDQIGVGKDPKVGASEPMYLWNNRQAGASLAITALSTSGCT